MSCSLIKMNVRQGLHLATSFPYKSMLVESINFFASREVAELRQVQEELLGANVNDWNLSLASREIYSSSSRALLPSCKLICQLLAEIDQETWFQGKYSPNHQKITIFPV